MAQVEVAGLIESAIEDGLFDRLANDPLAQFGPPAQQLLGAEILPEVNVDENEYTEEAIRFRTPVANHGTRYSPVQLKGGMYIGGFDVKLGYSDIGAQLKGREYDAFLKLLRRVDGNYGRGIRGGGAPQPEFQAMQSVLNWVDLSLVRPMLMRNEIDRWAMLVNAQVVMKGDNDFQLTVNYANPSGHRVNAGNAWSDDTYDPIAGDIVPMINFLHGLGYTVSRIITGQDVILKLAANAKVRQRGGILSIAGGVITGVPGLISTDGLNAILARDGIPPLEGYNTRYFTDSGSSYVFPRATMVFACLTGRDQSIAPRGDLEPAVYHDTLGYVGVGTPAMRTTPGRAIEVTFWPDGKNSHLDGQTWQASLPVLTDPEAVGVIKSIS